MRVPGVPYVQGENNYADADGRHYGIAIHNTANDASDTNEASYATHRPDGVSSHFYVDADSVTQSLDTDRRAGHAGSSEGNQNAIAFEITGVNAKTRAWWLANVCWSELGRVIAYLIQHDPDYAGFQVRRASVAEMRSNPKVKALYGHNDMRLAWGGTTHTDPGPNFPWDRLIGAVNTALAPPKPPALKPEEERMIHVQVKDADGTIRKAVVLTNGLWWKWVQTPNIKAWDERIYGLPPSTWHIGPEDFPRVCGAPVPGLPIPPGFEEFVPAPVA